MQKVIFTNSRGESITLHREPFLLTSISGTGAAEVEIQMQKAPFQDGQTYIDSLLQSRSIPIELVIFGADKEEIFQRRRELSHVFNPKLGPGTLKFEYEGGEKEIIAAPDLAPVFPSGMDASTSRFQRALINLICPSPFWRDTYTYGEEMSAWIGGLTFPISFENSFSTYGQEVILSNTGDVATPVTIEFNGPATNPKVENLTTGKMIKVVKPILAGEKLAINTGFGEKRVELIKSDGTTENAMHWLDLESEFWQLELGDNLVKYSADSSIEEATVHIKWRNRYVGI